MGELGESVNSVLCWSGTGSFLITGTFFCMFRRHFDGGMCLGSLLRSDAREPIRSGDSPRSETTLLGPDRGPREL